MRPISRCLNNQLLDICQRAVQLDELNDKLKLYLPLPLAEHCRVGSFNKGCLILTTTNPAWATELHYRCPELRDKLRKEAGLYQLISIKVAVVEATAESRRPKKTKSIIGLSIAAKDTIRTVGELCNYPPLKKALYHLAGTE